MDRCSALLQPNPAVLPPSSKIQALRWTSLTPNTDSSAFTPDDKGVTRMRTASDSVTSSAFWELPSGTRLKGGDSIQGSIRMAPSRPRCTFQIDLVSSAKEVFQYSEAHPLDQDWQPFHWELQDFRPCFWSRFPAPTTNTLSNIEFVKVTVRGLEKGDTVELRDFEIHLRPGHPQR